MQNLMKWLIMAVLMFSWVNAQDDTTGIQLDFQTGLAKFSFDGNFDNGDFGFGIMYLTPQAVIEPGLFITANVDLNTSENTDFLHTGLMLEIQIQRMFAVGVYYDFWETNKGLVKWYRNNTGFMFLYNFEF